MKTNIAIANDHHLLREATLSYLQLLGFNIVLTTKNGQELVQRLHDSEQLPHTCLIDLKMPVMNGIDTIIYIKQHWPSMRIVVFSMEGSDQAKFACLQQGADAYVLKGCDEETLISALETCSSVVPLSLFQET